MLAPLGFAADSICFCSTLGSFLVSKVCSEAITTLHQELISAIVVPGALLMDRNEFQQKANKSCFLSPLSMTWSLFKSWAQRSLPKSYYWQRQWSARGKMRTIAVALSKTAQLAKARRETIRQEVAVLTLCALLLGLKRTDMKCQLKLCQQIN